MTDLKTCERCGDDLKGHSITIYSADMQPKEVICETCDTLERIDGYRSTGQLSSSLLIDLALGSFDSIPTLKEPLQADQDAISAAIGQFEKTVWYKGLQQYVKEAKWKGHSMTTPTVKALLYAIAGRVMITLQNLDGGSEITLITVEDDDRRGCMGMQSICATRAQAVALLDQYMQSVSEQGLQFQPNNEVHILGT